MFSTNNCLTVNVNIGQEGLLLMFCSSSSLSFFSLPLHSASGFMDGNYKNKIVFCEKNFLVGLCTLHSIYPDGGSLSGSPFTGIHLVQNWHKNRKSFNQIEFNIENEDLESRILLPAAVENRLQINTLY